MIKVSNIHVSFGELQVLKGINLHIDKGELVSIIGSSGAGKTTLLQVIGTLEKPDSGTIKINNKDISKLMSNQLAKFRNQNIGFIFQFHNLLPEFTALENICLPAFINGKKKSESEEKAIELLKILDLTNRMYHKPNQLSGGERQRVSVARALINNPEIILADEPTGSLDSKNSEELYNLILKLNKEFNQTIVIVTHNAHLAKMTSRTLEIKDGVIQ